VSTSLPKTAVIDALAEEFVALQELLESLDDHAWKLPTPCPGWDVQANVAHMIGTESALAGHAAPEASDDVTARPHVRNDIGASNERWVAALAGATPAELMKRFSDITAARLQALRAMSDESWDAEGFTPAGTDSYGRFMRIRVFDCWMHEQDIRDAAGQPGHLAGPVVDLVLDEMTAALGYVVGKRAAVPAGSSVVFDLSGGSGRRINVLVGDRAAVIPALDGEPTVSLRMPTGVFTRLGGGRATADALRAEIRVEGDAVLGQQVLTHLAYTI